MIQSVEASGRPPSEPSTAGGPHRLPRRGRGAALGAAAALLGGALIASGAHGQTARGAASLDLEEPLFSLDSPIGPLAYRAGRGLRFGDTGLVVGGFTALEFDQEQRERGEFEIDAVNLLVLFEPIPRLSLFSEVELGDFFTLDTGSGRVDSEPKVELERLYADWKFADGLKARVGKFQTPVGRWNLVPAEPFVWTAIEPVGVEVAFDEYFTGAAIHGSRYAPGGERLDYWLYGQVTPQIDPESDPEPSERAVGGRLAWGRELAGWSFGSSFLATRVERRWSYLGGLDAQWRGERFELTVEALLQRGRVPDRDVTNVYVQGVYELCRDFYAVARYEHFDVRGRGRDPNLVDVGFAWVPLHFLHLKASYRFSDEQTEDVRRGVSASLSLLF